MTSALSGAPRPAVQSVTQPSVSAVPSAQDEVARICQELLRIDTSNYGDNEGPGERAAAEYVMGLLE